MEQESDRVIAILQKDDRKFEEIEFLIYFLQRFEEIKKYFRCMNAVVLSALCRVLKVESFQKQAVVCRQNTTPSNYFFILKGTLSVYDGTKFLYKLTAGKAIGEREITRSLQYSTTIIASVSMVYLLTLPSEQFLEFFGEIISKETLNKQQYLRMIIPNLHKLSQFIQEKLMQGLRVETFFKGETILSKNSLSDHLLLIVEGECAIVHNTGYINKDIIRIGEGNVYGEESVIFGKPTEYSFVSRTDCTIAFIRKSEVLTGFPDSVLKTLKNNFEFKRIQRNRVRDFSPEESAEDSGFPLASRYAKKKLAEIVSRSSRLSPSRLLEYHQREFSEFKEKLAEMRDSSPKRVFIPKIRHSNNKSLDLRRLSNTIN